MVRQRQMLTAIMLLITIPCAASAQGPQIGQVFPDFPGFGPHIITGEGFDARTSEVWIWEPPSDEKAILKAAAGLPGSVPPLPAVPPEGARRAEALDIEPQVIVASLQGTAVWVKTGAGVSAPYRINAARPFWLSRTRAFPGDVLHLSGFGVRGYIALKSRARALFPALISEPRSARTADSRLVYFEIPPDTPADSYDVWAHNGSGGAYGWRLAGRVRVLPPVKAAERVWNVRRFGAKGDGLANDTRTLQAALMAAKSAGGGVVFLPPGVYRTEATVVVPSGVRLQGASRDSSILQGFGYNPHADRVAWFTGPNAPPAAVVRLRDGASLDSLTVEGATGAGSGGNGLVEAVPVSPSFPDGGKVRNVSISGCRLRAAEEGIEMPRPLYASAVYIGPNSEAIGLLHNDIYGAVSFGLGTARRAEVIGNTIHGGASADVVSLGGRLFDSLVDSNTLTDTPGRIVLGMGWHNLIRYNEVHQAFRGTWANAEEVYLIHGGYEGTVSRATGASPRTLTDTRQRWNSDRYANATVLITAGRGFGQYRSVIGNTGNTLKLDRPWRIVPDAGSEYVVAPSFVENALFANLNNTPLRLSLWLNCIANVVEMHRDDHSKGMDIWGTDDSALEKDGRASRPNAFFPAYYNAVLNGWMDGAFAHLFSGANAANIHTGPPVFGNYFVGNRLRQSHMRRTGFDMPVHGDGAILIGNRSGEDMTRPQAKRTAVSHTIVAKNQVAFTNVGITVSDYAAKTFVLDNEFQEVARPILDWGAGSVLRGNRIFSITEAGEQFASLPDSLSEREIVSRLPSETSAARMEPVSPLFERLLDLKVFVSQQAYCFYQGIRSQKKERACAANLKRLYALLKRYDAQHGRLPGASLFPRRPHQDPDSLAVLLGEAARPLLTCPTSGPDFTRLGLNYAWNEKLSGRMLSSIPDPHKTWLLMDFVGAHDWMVANEKCGHRGGINILYADGSVRWSRPFSTEWWNKTAPQSWADWARE